MKYNVFYSYQSDIDKDINEKFIGDALNKAAKSIKSCELKIIKGFDGTSGNKPLAQTMFEQSFDSDIFVGDLSFTSSRASHIENIIATVFGKQYLSRVPGKIKMSPNPNVLLETGYSWAHKNYERTILVINEAFGQAKDFPVDMTHVRWPVNYTLTTEQKTDKAYFDKTFEGLVADLKATLNAAIRTTQKYHRERFRPIRIYEDWKDPGFAGNYEATDAIKKLLAQLRSDLSTPGAIKRLVGPKSCGKSRLVYELYQKHSIELKRDQDNIEKTLYYDLQLTSYASIEVPLQKLANLNQDKLLIVDNCDYRTHQQLTRELSKTNVRLLTVDEYQRDTKDRSDYLITRKIADEINKKVLSTKFNTCILSARWRCGFSYIKMDVPEYW